MDRKECRPIGTAPGPGRRCARQPTVAGEAVRRSWREALRGGGGRPQDRPRLHQFNHPVDWTWFKTWHDEGGCARHGASIMAPDHTYRHGSYDLARHWMTKFIPEIKEILHEYGDVPEARTEVGALRKIRKPKPYAKGPV